MLVTSLGSSVDYAAALDLQRRTAEGVRDGTLPETLFLLEHAPVYTIGRLRDQSSLRSRDELPHPVFEVQRGGQATYHGPGQLVGYPILDLRRRGKDLHVLLRGIEDVLLATADSFGIAACRRPGLTGVWVCERKLASIGVGVSRWISQHGFALNVTDESLPPFQAITPCGIAGVTMCCLAREASCPITVGEAAEQVAEHFQRVLGAD